MRTSGSAPEDDPNGGSKFKMLASEDDGDGGGGAIESVLDEGSDDPGELGSGETSKKRDRKTAATGKENKDVIR